MRYAIFALGIAACFGVACGWLQDAAVAGLDDAARSAIQIRCGGSEGSAERECRALHAKLFRAGALDPEKTLAEYCTAEKVVGFGRRPAPPPALCVERYGGWKEG